MIGLVPLCLVSAAAALAAGAWSAGGPPSGRRRVASGRFVLAAAAACAATAVAIGVATRSSTRHAPIGPVTERLVPVTGVEASTDRGLPVPLARPADADGADAGAIPRELDGRVIVAAEGDRRSNGPGWVFADGRYWVPTECIDAILRDNGYRRVVDPAPGDVVVYRDDDGRAFHAGIVKAVGAGGFVLVESKWGHWPVVWHAPDGQEFGDDHEYWHADRPGHALRILGP